MCHVLRGCVVLDALICVSRGSAGAPALRAVLPLHALARDEKTLWLKYQMLPVGRVYSLRSVCVSFPNLPSHLQKDLLPEATCFPFKVSGLPAAVFHGLF